MLGIPGIDDDGTAVRAFYPPQIIRLAAARERARHRDALRAELERTRQELVQAEAQADRLRRLQLQIESQLAGMAP